MHEGREPLVLRARATHSADIVPGLVIPLHFTAPNRASMSSCARNVRSGHYHAAFVEVKTGPFRSVAQRQGGPHDAGVMTPHAPPQSFLDRHVFSVDPR